MFESCRAHYAIKPAAFTMSTPIGDCSDAEDRRTIEPTVQGGELAVAYIQEFPITSRSTENYDFVAEKVGDGPFEGLIAHSAGFDDEAGVFRILDIWESQEHAQRFLREHIEPLIAQGPDAFPNPDNFTEPTRDGFYELHDVVSPARAHAISS